MSESLPAQAEIIVIGGGIIGCSTAYHLAKSHNANVLLLERGQLTCGTTFHAAGLVGQLRSSASITQLLKYSVELYDNLESETGLASGWKRNGGLRLANNQDRWIEIKRQATTARSFGLEMELLTPSEASDLWPLMDLGDLVGAAFMPADGQANPSDITHSLARGAQIHGVQIVENTSVSDVEVENGAVVAVNTSRGRIQCEKVVNCAGQWSKQLGRKNGICVPLQSMQHQYMVTEAMEGVTADLPTLRDPDRLIYFKEEVGGLVMGGYEPNPQPWNPNPIPEDFTFSLLDSDWDHFEQLMTQALVRVPGLKDVGIKTLVNGPESFTMDGNFILGEAPALKNYFVGTGFNAFGIASAGGAGMALASWVATGEQPMDLWTVDIQRFSNIHRDEEWVKVRTIEACSKHYTMAWPSEEYDSARPLLTSPLYSRMLAHNACFGSKLGWERPNWFAPVGVKPVDIYSFQRPNWFPHVGEEHAACRNSAVLFDQSSFAKFEFRGKDACEALNWICANNVDIPVGKLIYTQMLNSRGGIEGDITLTRIAEDAYYIVTGTGFRTHDGHWIINNTPPHCDAELKDVTEKWATLSLMGPNSRSILWDVSKENLDNESFPFASAKEITIAGYKVRAIRITYVGELGWELHVPVESALGVYDALWQAGQAHGLINAGYRAIDSLRLEKGYRAWSSDITPSDTPIQAGLLWAVKMRSGIPFNGRKALEAQISQPLSKLLCCFTLDNPNIVLNGRETILRNGIAVGYVSSAGWGYSVNSNIAYGYVRNEQGVTQTFLTEGDYALEVACEVIPCRLEKKVLFDPEMKKVKC
ncbi:MAG: FAD-dependent oxidoreductase [Gammaproteobacteria bacterium]|nr:FAD-dependent oxidoreductase [Gammaproteobacteria bacterium]